MQVICDADLLFIDIIAKWPGSVSDAWILRKSALCAAFEGSEKPVAGLLLGDSGYMLRDWLLTPIPSPQTPQERSYNSCHRSARVTVKRCISLAKRRWRCLHSLRVAPRKACQIITVCMMLHNWAMHLDLPDPDSESESAADGDSDDSEPDDDAGADDESSAERALAATGEAVRNQLCQHLNSVEG